MTTLKVDGRYYDADSIRAMESRLAQRDAEVERLRRENDVFAASLREMGVSVEQLRKNVSDAHRAFGAALSTPTETADGDVRRQALEAMPPAIHSLSRAESEAVAEIIPVAEDLSMRGDESATVALAWLRALASQDKGER